MYLSSPGIAHSRVTSYILLHAATGKEPHGSCRRIKDPGGLPWLDHGHFIRVLEVGPDGNAHGDACDADAQWLDELREIDGRRLALRRRIRSDDDFLDRPA